MFLSPVPTLRRKKGTEKLDPISCAHTEAEEWAQAELVQSTATLRYEPCTQFINVSQRALHIYFIDGCRVCPLDARYKNRTKQPLVLASSHRGIPFYFCMVRKLSSYNISVLIVPLVKSCRNRYNISNWEVKICCLH